MATKSFNHLKGKNSSLPPKRGKILCLILKDLMHKRVDNSSDAQKGETETTIGLLYQKGYIIIVGILEDLMPKLIGKNEPSVAQKRKNSSLPSKRGMIKIRILDELLQQVKGMDGQTLSSPAPAA